jgi:hypothetical protein
MNSVSKEMKLFCQIRRVWCDKKKCSDVRYGLIDHEQ